MSRCKIEIAWCRRDTERCCTTIKLGSPSARTVGNGRVWDSRCTIRRQAWLSTRGVPTLEALPEWWEKPTQFRLLVWSCKAMAGQEKRWVCVTSLIARLALQRIDGLTIESDKLTRRAHMRVPGLVVPKERC